MNNTNDKFIDPFERKSFSNDSCFVCGISLNDNNRTLEHIYPKWLQRKFDLYNQHLILLNGTEIKYKDLKVPCCKHCNEIMGNKIEKPMERAVESGYDEFIKLDRTIIFQWLNKLSYGMLYKELSLRIDRKASDSEMIMNEEILKELHMKYMFLKSIISEIKFVNSPFSLLIFKIDYDKGSPYWGHDGYIVPVFSMSLGEIGIIAHMQDNGYNEEYFKEFPEMKQLLEFTLHPIQFRELVARFAYKSSLFIKNPFYSVVFDEKHNPTTVISHEIYGTAFNDWDQKKYAEVLTHFLTPWGLTFDEIYKGNDLVISFVHNKDGTFKTIKT